MNLFAAKQKVAQKQVQVRNPDDDLTQSEIELILRLVSQTTFPVKDIETLYIALYKLQNQYKSITNDGQG